MISDIVKNYLKNYSHLLDENKKPEFLNQLWEEGLNINEVIELFSILNALNPPPISKKMREECALNALKELIKILNGLTPKEWEENYCPRPAIDKDGDLILKPLLDGFRMHTYGLHLEDLAWLARSNRDKIDWDGGQIYSR